MRKLYRVLILILSATLFTGCGMNPVEKSVSEAISRETIFFYQDNSDDGYGPGYYSYPNDHNKYRTNTYDLLSFSVEDAGEYVYMKFKFNEEIKRNNTLFGRWDQILIDVYIDKDQQPYSGEEKTLPGRDVEFNKNSLWESAVLISPLKSEEVKDFLDKRYEDLWTKLHYKMGDLIVPDFYIVSYDTITAKVPKRYLGTPRKWWGYQVVVMGFDGNLQTKDDLFTMEVRPTPGDRNFGGGSSYYGNPNVLDILDGSGKDSQKYILSNYEINPIRSKARFASLPMVYESKIEGKEKVDLEISKKAEEFLKREKKKDENNKKTEKNNITSSEKRDECVKQMRNILKAAKKYKKDNPDDTNITIFDLILSGYLADTPRCPEGGVYKVADDKKLKIQCIDLEGNLLHGMVE
ncbi:MAG: hypothetical protein C0601_08130 [Candidatus Muiribacterium halophilum]|uniref:Glucodextranase-like C-terminal domain-containing protein n=1 Tax=Muiribacterium halophilum TaxID=2053465 RepID=A0A2N5ZEW8_MUIH1|nr:MAG: hypothetical protein C0601_08130 [Candidatus Muirbacterium halophilum]